MRRTREDELAKLLVRFLSLLDHAQTCEQCVVDMHSEARQLALVKLKNETRVALGRRPN